MDIKINNECIERVYHTKFLGVQLDAKLSWKKPIEYISTKLAKCAGILIKARKKLPKLSLINLYHCFAYPYLIYCNHVWGNNYPTKLERLIIMQKKLIRIITCSPYGAHTEPLFYANKILNIKYINFYVVSVFMYNCVSSPLPGIFIDFCVPNKEFHRHDTRNANDLYVSFARLDIRKFSVRINGPNSWNALPYVVKQSLSISTFRYRLRKHIMSLKCCAENSQTYVFLIAVLCCIVFSLITNDKWLWFLFQVNF